MLDAYLPSLPPLFIFSIISTGNDIKILPFKNHCYAILCLIKMKKKLKPSLAYNEILLHKRHKMKVVTIQNPIVKQK